MTSEQKDLPPHSDDDNSGSSDSDSDDYTPAYKAFVLDWHLGIKQQCQREAEERAKREAAEKAKREASEKVEI